MVEQGAVDEAFRALGDATRRAMLVELEHGPRTISALAAPHAMTLAGASKHVAVLERAGLVLRTRRGRAHLISLNPAPLAAAHAWLSRYQRFWEARLDALEAVLQPIPDELQRDCDDE